MTDETEVVVEAEAPESEAEVVEDQPGVEAEEVEAEGEVEEVVDDGLVDLEIDGKVYRVPPNVREERMRHEDYTRKTQELAEQRRQLEQQPTPQQVEEEDLNDRGMVADLRQKLQGLQNVDWATYEQQDLLGAQSAYRQYLEMKDALRDAEGRIAQRQTARVQQQQTSFAKQVEEAQRVLTRDITGWGPELASKITAHATDLGFDQQTIVGLNTNPKAVKALHQSMLWAESQKKQRTASTPKVEPLAKPKGKARPVPSGPSDKQSIDAWMQNRNKQVRA